MKVSLFVIAVTLFLLTYTTSVSISSLQEDSNACSNINAITLGGESGNGKPHMTTHEGPLPVSLGGESGNGLTIKIIKVTSF